MSTTNATVASATASKERTQDRIARLFSRHVKKERYRHLATMIRGALLVQLAHGKTITYVDLSRAFGVFSGGKIFAKALGIIMREDHAMGDGKYFCTLVVSSGTGIPGGGYFELAETLHIFDPAKDKKEDFWAKCMTALGMTV